MNSLESRIYNTVLAYIGFRPVKSKEEIQDCVAKILPIFDNETFSYDIDYIMSGLYDFYRL